MMTRLNNSKLKNFLTLIFFLIIVKTYAAENIVHTIRCLDGVVLILGSEESIKLSKSIIQEKLNLQLKTQQIYNFLIQQNITGVTDINYYLSPQIKIQQEKIETLTIKSAEEKGLIPYIENKNIVLAKEILQDVGFMVMFNPTPIGTTNIFSPVDIFVESAGVYVGNYGNIYIDEKNVSLNQRGFNIVIVDNVSGKVEQSVSFDTWLSENESLKMSRFIKNIADGKIVICAVKDEGAKKFSEDNFKAIKSLGGKINFKGYRHFSYILVGIKGVAAGSAIESLSSFPLAVYVYKNLTKDLNTLMQEKLLAGEKIIYLTDTQKNSPIQITIDEDIK